MTRKSNDPVPVEHRLRLVLAVLAHELTVAEAARRHGVSTESINRWRNRFIDADAQRRGYEIVHPLTTEAWGIRRFFVRAPGGVVPNIAQHDDPEG